MTGALRLSGRLDAMAVPTLVVINGPAGTGKTTLAHALAEALGCPAICRDEIKEGMVHALGVDFQAAPGDPLTRRTFAVFFDLLRRLLEAEVTVVAEAAFEGHVWRPNLEALAGLGRIKVVRCQAEPAVARQRVASRPLRVAHADASVLASADCYDQYEPISMSVPTIDVETSNGYEPPMSEIVAFVNRE